MQYHLIHITLMLIIFLWCTNALQQRCLLHKGKCVPHCPPLMQPYHTRCDVDTVSQRTCWSHEIYVLGFTCGWSRCDCIEPLVLSDNEGCVPLADCKTGLVSRRKPTGRRKRRRGKKFKLEHFDDVQGPNPDLEPIHYVNEFKGPPDTDVKETYM